jgi:hypothetical protein
LSKWGDLAGILMYSVRAGTMLSFQKSAMGLIFNYRDVKARQGERFRQNAAAMSTDPEAARWCKRRSAIRRQLPSTKHNERGIDMSKLFSSMVAALFAITVVTPVAFAQDQKKEQVHKGTPEQGSVQKKEKAKKKDGSGKSAKADEKKAEAKK